MILPLLLAATLGFGERPVSDLQLVPTPGDARVASNGRNFIAAWVAQRMYQRYVFRAVIDGDGNVIDSAPIWKLDYDVVTGIASDGERYLIGFEDAKLALLLDENGNLVRSVSAPQTSAVASDGSTFALVTGNGVQLLDRDGGAIGVPISCPERIRAIAGAGSGYVVVTDKSVRTLQHGVLSAPVDGGAVGLPADITSAYGSKFAILWTGNEFIVSFFDGNGTNAVRVSREGTLLSAPTRLGSESGGLAWDGSRLLFAGTTIVRPFTASFVPLANERPFALYAVAQTDPRIATDGEAMLVLWVDYGVALRVALITAGGTPLDGAGIILDAGYITNTGAVGFDGRDWIIAYPKGAGIAIRRMSRAGLPYAETVLPSSGGAISIRIASPGDGHFVVVWESVNPPGDRNSGTIRASIDGGAPIDLTHGVDSYSDVTWDGSAFRLAWMNYAWIWSSPPGYIHQYTVPQSITFASVNMKGELAIDDVVPTRAPALPRVAGSFRVWQGNQGFIVRRGAEETTVRINQPTGFAIDDSGNAMLTATGGAVLLGNDDRQSFIAMPSAGEPDVVWTRNGWLMAYTRIIDDAPFFHVPRVFIRTIDTTPARRRTF